MKKPVTIALAVAAAASTSGCSQIGTINGVGVGPNKVAGDTRSPYYCDRNPAVCIVGAAAVVGGAALIINEINDEKSKAGGIGGDSDG